MLACHCRMCGVQGSSNVFCFSITKEAVAQLGSTRYTGSEPLERSLRIMPSHFTFQIQRLRREALAVGRHVVSAMVWMSLRSARCQNGAPVKQLRTQLQEVS